MYSNHPPPSSSSSKRYEYPQGYDSSQWPTTPINNPQPPKIHRYNTDESQEDPGKQANYRTDYTWFDNSQNTYSPPPAMHWNNTPGYHPQQRSHGQSPLQLPPTPSSTSSSTDISPHLDNSASKQQGYPFPITFQQQAANQQQSPANHRTPHWRIPATERPFKCDNCPLSFNRNHDLKRHARIHLSVKPFPCSFCDKRFSRKDALKRHMLVKRCGQAQAAKSAAAAAATNTTTNANNAAPSYYERDHQAKSSSIPITVAESNVSSNLFLPPPPIIQHRQQSGSIIQPGIQHESSNYAI
ncbi:hypothetical protein NQZ79_g2079 [Umbelopsis isabellina]|nr:hypothetical protein NQZ79_g2079 [Umbelopsis isabellina]